MKDHNTGRICAASKIYTPLRVMGVIVLSSQSKRVTMVLTTAVDNWESYKPGQKNLVTFNDVIGMKLTDLELEVFGRVKRNQKTGDCSLA